MPIPTAKSEDPQLPPHHITLSTVIAADVSRAPALLLSMHDPQTPPPRRVDVQCASHAKSHKRD